MVLVSVGVFNTNTFGGEVDTYGALLSLDFGGFIIGGYYAEHDVAPLAFQRRRQQLASRVCCA
jgi:hypothetical protein